jgi:CO dehydrogenase nickel-insertion accessory protein CooC1
MPLLPSVRHNNPLIVVLPTPPLPQTAIFIIKNIVAVANKIKNPEDEEAIRQFCAQTALPVIAIIPFDATIAEADKNGSLNINDIGHSPALQAISQLAEDLMNKVEV